MNSTNEVSTNEAGVDEYFKMVGEMGRKKKKNVKMQCPIWLPSHVVTSAANDSTSNLKRHIKSMYEI